MRRLLGLSLSFCVKDILAGRVQVNEVTEIVANTTGFVKVTPVEVQSASGESITSMKVIERGPNFDNAVDRYIGVYWRDFPRDRVEELLDHLIELQLIREEPHGLPGSWVDTSKPWFWGKVNVGDGHGVVGTYWDVYKDEVQHTPEDVKPTPDQLRHQ